MGDAPFSHWIEYLNSDQGSDWADVEIRVGQSQFWAHQMVLASHSGFLKDLFLDHVVDDGQTCVVIIPDLEPEQFRAIRDFMYAGQVPSDLDTLSPAQNLLRLEKSRYAPVVPEVKEEQQQQDQVETWVRSKRKRKKNRRLEHYEITSDTLEGKEEPESPGLDSTPAPEVKNETLVEEVDTDEGNTDDSESDSTAKTRISPKKKLTKRRPRKEDLLCCDQKFEDEVHFVTHKESVHLEKVDDSRFLICCGEKIMGTFDVHLKRRHHLSADNQQAICCNVTFQDLGELSKHCESRHGLKVSEYRQVNCCATKLANLAEYKEHKDQDNHVECSECAFLSTDERHLDFHKFNRHGQGTQSQVKKALSCKFCQRAFKHIHQRLEHEDKHDDSFKYDCQSCGKKFKLLTSLKSHVYRMGKNHNPRKKQYSCDNCEKIFPSIVSKRKHYRVAHQGKDAHSCIECNLVFVDKHRLDNHTKVVHLKVRDIQCTFCGKLFATQERMRIHEKFVHVIDTEGVQCDVCQKTFSNRERMVDHRRSVHRDRKYQCEACGSTFKNSSTLKSHVVSIHVEHQKKPLKCGVCGKGFLHDSRLKAHEIIHTDELPFKCQFCGRPNKCKNNNLKHEKRCKKSPENGGSGKRSVENSPAPGADPSTLSEDQSVVLEIAGDDLTNTVMINDLPISSVITMPADFLSANIDKDVLITSELN
ncbi:hypothetical protein TCAL_00410 [Tigriopus californicus]|uniref:BTB domain-containing protein n=2 Tax=Tigriopus californicus TaxID=6832 RepID=A0A553NB21_TIGCA|nr:hypothetical protein TCAL_00410 [Tigriopus californicus]|eukprot:TCALIF_00410-PA protein Name:"Similar to ZNF431 Zinc finger protein 431 (Homo sapiens)" AED:0.13 eAED:0.13 QI:0/0/0/1/1/1/2/0/699